MILKGHLFTRVTVSIEMCRSSGSTVFQLNTRTVQIIQKRIEEEGRKRETLLVCLRTSVPIVRPFSPNLLLFFHWMTKGKRLRTIVGTDTLPSVKIKFNSSHITSLTPFLRDSKLNSDTKSRFQQYLETFSTPDL